MKNFSKKLGFRKMDEMEQNIYFKSQRNAYIFLMLALLAWTVYEAVKVFVFKTSLCPIPAFLLLSASAIQSFSQLIMARNAVKDDEDSYETSPLFKIILWVCIVAGIIAAICAAVMTMGVKL